MNMHMMTRDLEVTVANARLAGAFALEAHTFADALADSNLEGREHSAWSMRDAATRLAGLATDPTGERGVERLIPSHWLDEHGDTLPGYEAADDWLG